MGSIVRTVDYWSTVRAGGGVRGLIVMTYAFSPSSPLSLLFCLSTLSLYLFAFSLFFLSSSSLLLYAMCLCMCGGLVCTLCHISKLLECDIFAKVLHWSRFKTVWNPFSSRTEIWLSSLFLNWLTTSALIRRTQQEYESGNCVFNITNSSSWSSWNHIWQNSSATCRKH